MTRRADSRPRSAERSSPARQPRNGGEEHDAAPAAARNSPGDRRRPGSSATAVAATARAPAISPKRNRRRQRVSFGARPRQGIKSASAAAGNSGERARRRAGAPLARGDSARVWLRPPPPRRRRPPALAAGQVKKNSAKRNRRRPGPTLGPDSPPRSAPPRARKRTKRRNAPQTTERGGDASLENACALDQKRSFEDYAFFFIPAKTASAVIGI